MTVAVPSNPSDPSDPSNPSNPSNVTLLPDAGLLITLAYASALDVLFKPGWRVAVVDMVQHALTRYTTPTSAVLAKWLRGKAVESISTQTFAHAQKAPQTKTDLANLGELSIQESINMLALEQPRRASVLLFEDHRIASTNFFLPDGSQKVSTRAFLIFLEQKGHIPSAADIERRAILAGRQFSQLRFPA